VFVCNLPLVHTVERTNALTEGGRAAPGASLSQPSIAHSLRSQPLGPRCSPHNTAHGPLSYVRNNDQSDRLFLSVHFTFLTLSPQYSGYIKVEGALLTELFFVSFSSSHSCGQCIETQPLGVTAPCKTLRNATQKKKELTLCPTPPKVRTRVQLPQHQ
jgi:hypothetical protein